MGFLESLTSLKVSRYRHFQIGHKPKVSRRILAASFFNGTRKNRLRIPQLRLMISLKVHKNIEFTALRSHARFLIRCSESNLGFEKFVKEPTD
ncbi:MAG: hypothetical protein OSA98_08185 [Rubripirellula sp.]|jgi:hypothetical protein|nr:hypothetical protein [Rubripirellula sp.]